MGQKKKRILTGSKRANEIVNKTVDEFKKAMSLSL